MVQKYSIVEKLEEGNYAVIFKVKDPDENIKVLKIARNKEWNEIIKREFKILSQLNHPRIIQVHDYGLAEGCAFFILEYIAGEAINQYFTGYSEKFLSAILQVTEALGVIHEKGFVHSDLKPEHILYIPQQEKIVLIDFGFAAEISHPVDRAGTIGYIAPEVLKGIGFDGRADLYSLGVIIYEILTDHKPTESYQTITGISDELNKMIARLLSKEPALRPSVAELHAALEKNLGKTELSAPPYKTTLPKTGFVKIPEIFDILSNATGQAAIIFGDTGSGKTRLLKELKFEFLINGCELFFHNPKTGENLVNELWAFAGGDVLDISNYEDKLQIYDELLSRLLKIAQTSKLVIMVDDAEMLSGYETGLLRYIGYGIKDADISCVIASKAEDKIKNLGFESLVMRPFNQNETQQLLEKTFFRIEPLGKFAEWLYDYSGGNPLFIIEIFNHLFAKKTLCYHVGMWTINEKVLSQVGIFPKLTDMLQDRFGKLSAHEQKILKIVAFSDIALQANIIDSLQGESSASLEKLKSLDFLKEEVVENKIVYFIPNRVVKQVINEKITEDEKSEMQKRLFVALKTYQAKNGSAAPILARLSDAQGEKKQAARYYLESARAAEKIHDYETALKYYEDRANCITETEPREFPPTLLKIANINQLIGKNKIAIDYYDRILAEKSSNLEKEAYLGLGFTYATTGDHENAVAYYRKAIGITKNKNVREYIHVVNYLGYSLLHLSKFNDAEGFFTEALATAKNIKDIEMEAETQYYQAVLEWFRNNYDAGIRKAEENRNFTEQNKFLKQHAYATNLLSSFYQQKNKLALAQQLLDEVIKSFKKLQHINSMCNALVEQGILSRNQGAFLRAQEFFNNSLWITRQTNNQTALYSSLLGVAIVYERFAKFDDAITTNRNAHEVDKDKPEPVYGMVMLYYIKGEFEKAKSILEQAMVEKHAILYYFGQAILESAIGNYEKGRVLLNEGLSKIETDNPDTETKIETYLRTSQFCHEKGDFGKSNEYAHKLLQLTNTLSREFSVASAIIKINNYYLTKIKELDINAETDRLTEIGCIYDWAWLKRLAIESKLSRDLKSEHLKSIGEELIEIEEIFKTLGAGLELKRTGDLKDKIFPIIIKDYSRRAISSQYLTTFSGLANLISQHLGDENFVPNILDLIIQATNAERGALFIKGAQGMEFAAGRNMDKTTIRDAHALSKTAIEAVKKEAIIFSLDALQDPHFSAKKSVILHHIRALVCIPLITAESVIGAIYLDSRTAGGIFGPEDKDFLVTVSKILASVIEKSIVYRNLLDENILLKSNLLQEIGSGYIVGESPQMKVIYGKIADIAPIDSPVLITGETGTGKGMIARLIHLASKRKDKKFLSINCGTVTETLFESELFGHKRGSFTGAITDKRGLLEEAEGGTVFLDEITNTRTAFQAKLLEAIEDKVIRRVGETTTQKIDVRFLFATNKDIEIEVEDGRLRKDLYYRINVFRIDVPPLRERDADIPMLALFFLQRYTKEVSKKITGFSNKAMLQLRRHVWQGNVRELQNVIERAVISSKDKIITEKDLGFQGKAEVVTSLREIKKEAIIAALQSTNWHILKAAEILNINRKTIHRYIKKYNIRVE